VAETAAQADVEAARSASHPAGLEADQGEAFEEEDEDELAEGELVARDASQSPGLSGTAAVAGAPGLSPAAPGVAGRPPFEPGGEDRRGRRRRRRRRGRGGMEPGMPGMGPPSGGGGGLAAPPLGGTPGAGPPLAAAASAVAAVTPGGSVPAAGVGAVTGAQPGDRYVALADAAYEILRQNADNRPIHVKQITDMALKRRLLRADGHDLWRTLRVALQQEIRERLTSGLRPRIRFAGGALFASADRRVETDLLAVERQLAERAETLRRATRQAITRRVGRLPPPAYETLARLLLERLGFGGLEMVKRTGEALYLAASRPRGGNEVRTLVSVRAGAEQARFAVGELRAGVAAKGFTDGLLVAAGRILPDAVAEAATTGPSVELWDGDHVAGQLARLGIGIVRSSMPVDYLDADFFADLQEA
jgi:hypothetical protein